MVDSTAMTGDAGLGATAATDQGQAGLAATAMTQEAGGGAGGNGGDEPGPVDSVGRASVRGPRARRLPGPLRGAVEAGGRRHGCGLCGLRPGARPQGGAQAPPPAARRRRCVRHPGGPRPAGAGGPGARQAQPSAHRCDPRCRRARAGRVAGDGVSSGRSPSTTATRGPRRASPRSASTSPGPWSALAATEAARSPRPARPTTTTARPARARRRSSPRSRHSSPSRAAARRRGTHPTCPKCQAALVRRDWSRSTQGAADGLIGTQRRSVTLTSDARRRQRDPWRAAHRDRTAYRRGR